MRRVPVKVSGLGSFHCSAIKLSHRLQWRADAEENPHIMIPSLLALCIQDDEGKPVKSADQWDEWAGENTGDASDLFNQCVEMIGTVESAKKK